MVLTGYPWLLVGQPMIDVPALAAPAMVGGQYLVGLLVAVVAGAVADVLGPGSRRLGPAVAGLGFCVAVVAGANVLVVQKQDGGIQIDVGVVQTNVPQDNKIAWTVEQRLADWLRFEALTSQAAESRPDLIVWPETMFPGMGLDAQTLEAERSAGLEWALDRIPPEFEPDARRDDEGRWRVPTTVFADRLLRLQSQLGVPIVIGSIASRGTRFETDAEGRVAARFDARFNSVFLVRGGAIEPARYDKMKLTPFGEVIPYVSAWPWLERMAMAVGAHGMRFDLEAGSSPHLFEAPVGTDGRVVRFATPICFEPTWTGQARGLVYRAHHRRADLLVNLTNDGWFGSFDAGRAQHLLAVRWRCLELGVPMVRAANTGISALIDSRGRVVSEGVQGGHTRTDGVLLGRVTLPDQADPGTPYARIGNVVGFSVLGLTGALLGASVLVPRLGGGRSRRGGVERAERAPRRGRGAPHSK